MAVLLVASACTMSSDETPSTIALPSATSAEIPTTTTSLPEGTFGATIPFDPPKAVVTDSFVQYDLVFVDGSRMALSLPRVLADEIVDFTPAGAVSLEGHSRELDIHHGTVADMFGDATPLATYMDAYGKPVPYYSVASSTANCLAFQFGSWVVLVWDDRGTSLEPSADDERTQFASLLGGYETEDGYLVLVPAEPMTVSSLDGAVGAFRGEMGSDLLVGIVRGDEVQTGCGATEQTTARGYEVSKNVTLTSPDLFVCTPDRTVRLSFEGPFLTLAALDTIEIRTLDETSAFVPPAVSATESSVLFDVAFLDGSRLALNLPRVLADRIGSYVPAAAVGWDATHSRSLDVRYGTIADVFGEATPLATYRDANGSPVPYFAGENANYLAFQFGSWVVLAWDEGPGSGESFSDADRTRFASLLGGHETEDGYLVLDPVAPMTVGPTDSPDGTLSATDGNVGVGILRGEVAQMQCPADAATTAQGYGVTAFGSGGTGVCVPDHSVLLSIWGLSLSQTDLDRISVSTSTGPLPEPACANDTSGRVDPLEPNGVLAVYFSCRADPLLTFYVRTTGRPIGEISSDVASQLNEVITLYADGPTAEEQVNGYGAFAGLQLPINSVSLVGGRAIIDFGAGITDINGLGTSSFDGIVLSELQANVFQFPDVDELELDIEGDCERFGEMMEYGRCLMLTRAEWEAQSAP